MDSAAKDADSSAPKPPRTERKAKPVDAKADAVEVARKVMKRHPKTFANLAK